MRPAQPTSAAEITKRRFEYKAVSLTNGIPAPSCCTKTTPLWPDYVRSTDAIPAELAAVLNGPDEPSGCRTIAFGLCSTRGCVGRPAQGNPQDLFHSEPNLAAPL